MRHQGEMDAKTGKGGEHFDSFQQLLNSCAWTQFLKQGFLLISIEMKS